MSRRTRVSPIRGVRYGFRGWAGFNGRRCSTTKVVRAICVVSNRRHPAVADHHYLTGVREGWYVVTDQRRRAGFGLVFPTKLFPNVSLFRTFSGWRGLYTLILEASTGCSRDLKESRQKGECARLSPGQTREVDVLAVAYSGVSSVSRIEAEGRVIPGEPR
jgi:hypothetical protein